MTDEVSAFVPPVNAMFRVYSGNLWTDFQLRPFRPVGAASRVGGLGTLTGQAVMMLNVS